MKSLTQPHTRHSCVTQEKLEKAFGLNDNLRGNCPQRMIRQTPAVWEIAGTCRFTGTTMTQHGTITATSRETVIAHVEIVNDTGTGVGNATVDLTGQWLATSCAGKDGDPG